MDPARPKRSQTTPSTNQFPGNGISASMNSTNLPINIRNANNKRCRNDEEPDNDQAHANNVSFNKQSSSPAKSPRMCCEVCNTVLGPHLTPIEAARMCHDCRAINDTESHHDEDHDPDLPQRFLSCGYNHFISACTTSPVRGEDVEPDGSANTLSEAPFAPPDEYRTPTPVPRIADPAFRPLSPDEYYKYFPDDLEDLDTTLTYSLQQELTIYGTDNAEARSTPSIREMVQSNVTLESPRRRNRFERARGH